MIHSTYLGAYKFSFADRAATTCKCRAVWSCKLQDWVAQELNFLCQSIFLLFIVLSIYNFARRRQLGTTSPLSTPWRLRTFCGEGNLYTRMWRHLMALGPSGWRTLSRPEDQILENSRLHTVMPEPGWPRGHCTGPQIFGKSVHPIPMKGADPAHPLLLVPQILFTFRHPCTLFLVLDSLD